VYNLLRRCSVHCVPQTKSLKVAYVFLYVLCSRLFVWYASMDTCEYTAVCLSSRTSISHARPTSPAQRGRNSIVCGRNTSRQSRYPAKDISTPQHHSKTPGSKAISLKPLSRFKMLFFLLFVSPPGSGRPFPCAKITPAIR